MLNRATWKQPFCLGRPIWNFPRECGVDITILDYFYHLPFLCNYLLVVLRILSWLEMKCKKNNFSVKGRESVAIAKNLLKSVSFWQYYGQIQFWFLDKGKSFSELLYLFT